MSVPDFLCQVLLFVDMSEGELLLLADCLVRRVFPRDTILFHKGSPARSLYLIESGAVRIFTLSEAGQEITLDIYGPNECFGESALLDGNFRNTGAVALKETIAHTLNRNDFLHCVERQPQMARRVMVLLLHRLEQVTAYAENLAFLDVSGRVAIVLAKLATRCGSECGSIEIELPLTQSELASWCGASREMVNKVLHSYREQGLITMEGHKIVIQDLVGLKRRIEW